MNPVSLCDGMNAQPGKNVRIVLLNPPHTAIGSRIPQEHLPPLGLLSIGGPLIDAGFDVHLVDADREFLAEDEIVSRVSALAPRMLMIGHSGSSTAHATVVALAAAIKAVLPEVVVIYGGVFPTYHWDEILQVNAAIDYVVRGEGERTANLLVAALAAGDSVEQIAGIAYRKDGQAIATPNAGLIQNLDDYRVGWELIDPANYSYWGNKRAVVVQFSRGCPICAIIAASADSGLNGGIAIL